MTGSGTALDPYVIWDVVDLQNIILDLTAYYQLGQDIDASGTAGWNWDGTRFLGFAPVGIWGSPFTGSFDGKGYRINELYIDRPAANRVGLFGLADPIAIQNVTVESANITCDFFGGILIGLLDDTINQGTVENCHVSGQLTAKDWAGGFTSRAEYNNRINRCSANVTINIVSTGGHCGYSGGFIGANYAQVEQCFSTGNISLTGFAGRDIDYVGGFAGHHWSGREIRQCYTTVTVNINGVNLRHVSEIGGFVGNIWASTVYDSYSTGDVNINVTATGNQYRVAGFVGSGEGVYRSYSTGAITAPGFSNVGGFIGLFWGPWPVEACFWDIETSGQTASAGGTGKNTAEMKSLATFLDAGWDIMARPLDKNNGYPYLAWQSVWYIFVAAGPPPAISVLTLAATEIR